MFFYKFLLSLILFLSFDIFKNNKLNAAGKLLITADGTYVNNTDRTADYGIEGNGSPSIDVTNTATLTATNYDGMFSCCGGTVTFNNSGTITAIRNGIGQFGGTSDFTNSGTDSQGNEIFPRDEANFITPYILSPADNQTMYMGGERIYKYNALSQNWTTTNNGYRLDGNAMSELAGSEQDPNVVYAASSPKLQRPHIYRTANGGDTWRQITRDLPDRFPTDLAVDPNNDLVAYVTFGGFETSHVYRTEDGGESWQDIGKNLPDIPTWSITVNPNNSSHLFVGNEIGVYQSIDSGKNWQNINGNLPDAVFAIDLIVSRSNSKLRLATHGNGAYEIDIKQLTNTEDVDDTIKGFELLQNYPNPFNPSTSISYILPKDSFVTLEIFNSLGQRVEQLVSTQQSAGKYVIKFDGSNMSSGTYFYKLTTPSFSETKKMSLIK